MDGEISKKRKSCHDDIAVHDDDDVEEEIDDDYDDDDDDEEKKIEKFFSLIRSIREARDHIIMNGGGSAESMMMIKEEENKRKKMKILEGEKAVSAVWNPSFRPEDFATDDANKLKFSPMASSPTETANDKEEIIEASLDLKLSL